MGRGAGQGTYGLRNMPRSHRPWRSRKKDPYWSQFSKSQKPVASSETPKSSFPGASDNLAKNIEIAISKATGEKTKSFFEFCFKSI